MTDNYDYIHQASNERLAQLLECEIGFRYRLEPQDKKIIEEAVRRLRIPPYLTSHEEYMGEV